MTRTTHDRPTTPRRRAAARASLGRPLACAGGAPFAGPGRGPLALPTAPAELRGPLLIRFRRRLAAQRDGRRPPRQDRPQMVWLGEEDRAVIARPPAEVARLSAHRAQEVQRLGIARLLGPRRARQLHRFAPIPRPDGGAGRLRLGLLRDPGGRRGDGTGAPVRLLYRGRPAPARRA